MRLGVNPLVFLGRAVVLFVVSFVVWAPFAPYYTQLLGWLTQLFLSATEISSDPRLHQVSEVWVEGTGIFYRNRLFPALQPPGIPAEWVQANIVLLIPLMLATPAPTWVAKIRRLGVALALALVLQVADLALTIKAFHAYDLPNSYQLYGDVSRRIYGFADAFAQSMDTQLFPFVIWAGIHFRQLMGFPQQATSERAQTSRAERRRAAKQEKG